MSKSPCCEICSSPNNLVVVECVTFCPKHKPETLDCGCPVDGDDVCEECCEHYDTEDRICTACGYDATEDMMNAAHERSEGYER